ncbi:MAG: DNA polymerase III subunit gamma/tau, partial [Acidobacteria bacterium]|nr:DNA polymerase III subunit gamma/tau [Acidobacteriota bacterium]
TESHKIPVTIASRCQQFSFRSVDFDELVNRMRWICEQEGIGADEESLAVLAQVGEGSVRDSLSALDQAIAGCGANLTAVEVRELLGLFSLDSLGTAAQALRDGDPGVMLDIVLDLESNGRSLQHYCRELARDIRNLLVKKIAPSNPRLIAASAPEQARLAEVAAWFTEEDLTRYLQITLDLFKDLQNALQPRLHMELGLLRLVHAGRLQSLEEALASVGSGGGGGSAPQAPPKASPPRPPSPPSPPRAQFAAAPPVAPVAPVSNPIGNDSSDWRTRLFNGLHEHKLPHTADAIESSTVEEQNGQLIITVPHRLQEMTLKSDLPGVIDQIAGRPMKFQIKIGQVQQSQQGSAMAAPRSAAGGSDQEEETRARAMAHPDVQRFQQMFPDAQIRQVRNLKE